MLLEILSAMFVDHVFWPPCVFVGVFGPLSLLMLSLVALLIRGAFWAAMCIPGVINFMGFVCRVRASDS